jgi:DedD protein
MQWRMAKLERAMAKRQMDDEDSLKRQARRRLIGAVALVTAVVVILPMVLDSEPRMPGQNIDLRIPDPDKAGEFKSQVVLPAESAPVSEPAAAGAQTSSASAATSAPTVGNSKQAAITPGKSGKIVTPVKTASKPAEKQQPAPKQGFAVQVGAYSSTASANKIEVKLKKLGFRAYTEKTGGNIRVRVGPYATREAAEKDLRKLEAQGMHPVLATLG